MTDQDRGAYTPQTDAPLAFDARYSRGSGDGPPPLTLIISGIVLVALVAALAFFYRGGVRGSNQTPQVVGTPVADVKSPPSGQAAAPDPAAGLQVYKSEATPSGEPGAAKAVLAPPPEAPMARPSPPTLRVADAANLRPAQPEAPMTGSALPSRATVPAAPPAAGQAAVALVQAPKPKPMQPARVAARAAAPEAAEIPLGAPVAQIGAFSSSALAEKGWSDVAVAMPTQMAHKTRKIEMAVNDGKTFYRAFVGGFPSKAAADAFCGSLRAAGKGCMVK